MLNYLYTAATKNTVLAFSTFLFVCLFLSFSPLDPIFLFLFSSSFLHYHSIYLDDMSAFSFQDEAKTKRSGNPHGKGFQLARIVSSDMISRPRTPKHKYSGLTPV
ncbi:hypothetical protein F5B22DRAFT_300891 [Xylaria bambusicola]|uniref:uncharacterized protein n=1 Tax=Xylaria bambusicola TaxID=326684 RepID=UPI002008D040|nr:uncharacterized protein F5B22DRAFT_300891 [Xylaria bambusicola]KAI0512662.1 hypothetical protein F5B22DRAFT_300891 [Xylaria bambusicola]